MVMTRVRSLLAAALVLLPCTASAQLTDSGGVRDTLGPGFSPGPPIGSAARRHAVRPGPDAAGRLRYWNEVAIDAGALDHTPVEPGEQRIFGEQIGPGRTSRALAIVHIALFEAINAIGGGYRSYAGLPPAGPGASLDAAIAQAAHDTLVALYPSQSARFDQLLADDLRRLRLRGHPLESGLELGRSAAATILALRAHDGSHHSEPRIGIDFFPSVGAGLWRPDPISMSPLALGAHWGEVQPFVLASSDQYRSPNQPPMDTPAYTAAFDEVKALGGDGIVTPTIRSAEQTEIGVFWGYDGTPGLGAPPRLYNQIAVQIADEQGSDVFALARLLALVNVALADTGIAAWETKYYYQCWRPVDGIRESDEGTGPTGTGDGNADTIGDPTFTPLGAQASNLTGPNFTPPFPAYPSGHAAFGAALFQTLRRFYGTDDIGFTFVSDELNGVTQDNTGHVRPRRPRSFATLAQAEEENGQSRIYLGIHWSFDKTGGIDQGRKVANYVFDNAFQPVD